MHSTTTSGLFNSDADDILPFIPEVLRQYLVDTEKPQEIYQLVGREHDRRLRLLLRRFTNQIQYGCTNPHCNIPTCLSYRKRKSPGPLRPYTDLTARALAVKCLEQYATHGRDLARCPTRDKGKKKQSIPSSDGLCRNDPIVPWYSDPDDHFARKKPVPRRRASEERKSSNTDERVVGGKTLISQHNSRSTVGRHRFSGPLDSHGIAQQTHPGIEEQLSPQSDVQEQYKSAPCSSPSSGPKVENANPTNGHVQCLGVVSAERNRRDYDQASLPQALFKHPRLQFWNESPSNPHTSVEATQEAQRDTQRLDTVTSSLSSKSTSSGVGLFQVDRPVTTFRILPPEAIQWFRETFLKYREEGVQAPEMLRMFLAQCLYFVIGNPTRLLQSASTWNSEHTRDSSGDLTKSRLRIPVPTAVMQAHDMIAQCFDDSDRRFHIATNLLCALQNCYTLPHCIKQVSHLTPGSQSAHEFLSNSEIAHVILVVLSMIPSAGLRLAAFRGSQVNGLPNGADEVTTSEGGLQTMDFHDDTQHLGFNSRTTSSMNEEPQSSEHHIANCRLCESIADLVSHRIAIDSAIKALRNKAIELSHGHGIVSEVIALIKSSLDDTRNSSLHRYHATHMLSCMQMVIFLKWDRTATINRTGAVGGALEMLKGLFIHRRRLLLDDALFSMDCVPAALDEVEMPFAWLSFKPDSIRMHILQFSFLFPPRIVVRYFRSLNLKIMKQSHEDAMAVYANGRSQLLNPAWKVANIDEVLNLTRSRMARYFVMTIRRSDILEDAIGQIWQRERRELLRPLKVTLGKEEGENGLDHGGVQQEFFRLAFAQAFDSNYGMFDIDPTTHMTWFKPGSLEQTYKYEAIGILMSLAIYNGVTIPITMPLAFYRKILGLRVKNIVHIEDGWPELAQSFSQLLAWNEGDVEDVMALTYDFSYDSFGRTVTIDMAKKARLHTTSAVKTSPKGKERASTSTKPLMKPVKPLHETVNIESSDLDNDSDPNIPFQDLQQSSSTPVTNANREDFVRSYIDHLTNITIQPQFKSFLKGLYTLLSPTALSLFTPSHLKLLFEGHPTSHAISVASWRAATKYEDFTPDEPIMTWFWDILEHDFTQTQMRKLLEFVTASNRLPVGGWDGVTFIVQRNGGGDDRLPGSSTCYGRLLLPEYSCKEVLRERLTKAVEEGLGFGMI